MSVPSTERRSRRGRQPSRLPERINSESTPDSMKGFDPYSRTIRFQASPTASNMLGSESTLTETSLSEMGFRTPLHHRPFDREEEIQLRAVHQFRCVRPVPAYTRGICLMRLKLFVTRSCFVCKGSLNPGSSMTCCRDAVIVL